MDNIQLTIKSYMLNNKGQAIVMLILIMTVALAIGLSIVQKSLFDVSSSSKVEQSSRAFSAAGAGVEKALAETSPNPASFTPGNNSTISSLSKTSIPVIPDPGGRQDALEILNLKKEDIGQVWLADYKTTVNPPTAQYTNQSLEIYWGDPAAKNSDGTQDYAALELTLVYYGTDIYTIPAPNPNDVMYRSHKWYLESKSGRDSENGFTLVNTCAGCNNIIPGTTVQYNRKSVIGRGNDIDLPSYPILLRARLLYNTNPQPFAVRTTSACGGTCTLPPQKTVIDSVGVAGETQRKINVTQTYSQVPFYFDYAIFSVGDITK